MPGAVVALGLAMIEAVATSNQATGVDFQLRVGIHTGPVVAGVIGRDKFIYDVWGDTVNLASRMESTGAPGAIHVTDSVYQQTRHRFAFEAREPVEIRGRGMISSYWLRGPLSAAVAAA